MRVLSVAVIGKKNNPLFIKNYDSTHHDLKYHYIAHTSCDFIEEKSEFHLTRVTFKSSEKYLGLLNALEQTAVQVYTDSSYGYVTNTRIKFILIVEPTDGVVRDAELKPLFDKLHQYYVDLVSNPFIDPEALITAPRFTQSIAGLVASVNK